MAEGRRIRPPPRTVEAMTIETLRALLSISDLGLMSSARTSLVIATAGKHFQLLNLPPLAPGHLGITEANLS